MTYFNANNADINAVVRSSWLDTFLFSLDKQKIHFFKNLVQEYNIEKVLDIACGTGDVVFLLSRWGKEVTAMQKEPSIVQELYAKSHLENLNLEIMQGDMRDISIIYKKRCDLILSLNNSLSKLSTEKDIWGTLAQVYLKLEPGGLVVIHTLDYDRLLQEKEKSIQLLNGDFKGQSARVYFTCGGEGENSSLVYSLLSNEKEEIIEPVRPILRKELNMWLAELGFEKIQNVNWLKQKKGETDSWDLITIAFRPAAGDN